MKRPIIILAATSITVITAFGAGCSSGESLAGGDAATSAELATAPSFSQIDAALNLDSTDETMVRAALADWDRDNTGAQRPGLRARRSEMSFVATVAPSLDDDQLTKLVDLFVARREARRAEMREHRGEGRQLKRLDSVRTERTGLWQKRRAERAERRVEHRAAWLDAALELSDEQTARVKTALTTMTETQSSIHKALKEKSITREQAGEQMRAARETLKAALKLILTAEQEARLEILEPLLPGRRHHA